MLGMLEIVQYELCNPAFWAFADRAIRVAALD